MAIRVLVPVHGLLLATALAGAEVLSWQRTEEVPVAGSQRSLDSLLDLAWRDAGGPEGRVRVVPAEGGGRELRWEVTVDHHNAGAYPVGWPSFEIQPKPALDFRGGSVLRFRIRAAMDRERTARVRFILPPDRDQWHAGDLDPGLPGHQADG